jgi:hypothetical protein
MTSPARSWTLGLTAVVVLALATGCGGPADHAPAPEPSSAAPSRPATPSPSGPIRYARTGGLAGLYDVLVIAPDGTVTLTSRRPRLDRTGRLTAAERAALTAAVPQGRVPEAARLPRDPHPDGFIYTVTLDTSQFRFTGAEVPADLAGLVRTLRVIAGRMGRYF